MLMKRNENDYIEHVNSCSGVENTTISANLTIIHQNHRQLRSSFRQKAYGEE